MGSRKEESSIGSSSPRRKEELVSIFHRALDDLTDDLINDSVSYCACVLANFTGDRHKNRLVEIRLKVIPEKDREILLCKFSFQMTLY